MSLEKINQCRLIEKNFITKHKLKSLVLPLEDQKRRCIMELLPNEVYEMILKNLGIMTAVISTEVQFF